MRFDRRKESHSELFPWFTLAKGLMLDVMIVAERNGRAVLNVLKVLHALALFWNTVGSPDKTGDPPITDASPLDRNDDEVLRWSRR
jgi:hypothetical protein